MCLRIDQKFHYKMVHNVEEGNEDVKVPKWAVAKTDIVCRKRLVRNVRTGKLITPYQSAEVQFDEHGVAELKSNYNFRGLRMSVHETSNACFFDVYEGIHALRTAEHYHPSDDEIYYAVIPRGTKFYVGTWDDIVSERLLIFKDYYAFQYYMRNKGFVTAKWLIERDKWETERYWYISEWWYRRFSIDRFVGV